MHINRYKKVAIDAALKAGAFINRHVGKIKEIRYKGEINVVTDIDTGAEEIIVRTIGKVCPGHTFFAEEGKYGKGASDFTWIIDPLDGTTNFLHGFPFFCVSIALAYCGRIIMGVVYDPSKNELFHAARTQGAFLNRSAIAVSKASRIDRSLLATGFAYNVKRVRNNNIKNFVNFLKASQGIRRGGSAALDLCYVACGRFDGFWELFLNPWDTAAGALIVDEAGGKISKFDGSKYNVYDKNIIASNSLIHSKMVRILSKD
ncbi:MAG: inositol monophosphatase family protein [Candidatus Omnitrophota bacterium]